MHKPIFKSLFTTAVTHNDTIQIQELPSSISEVTTQDIRELYAPPLMPLKERDWRVLAELFEREDVDEIEADISNKLLFLIPEPCWEDDPFDFLREYL